MIINKYIIKSENPLEYEFEITRTKTRIVVDELVEIVDDSGNCISPRNPRKFNQKTSTNEIITAVSLPSREKATVTVLSSMEIDNDPVDIESINNKEMEIEKEVKRRKPVNLTELLNIERPGSIQDDE